MASLSILLSTAILISGSGQLAVAPSDGIDAGRVALGRVCLPGILEAQRIEPLALAQGMTAVPSNALGGLGVGPLDKAWGLGKTQPALVVAWNDGSCTAMIPNGDKDAARAMAEKEILARPEGFKRGAVVQIDGGRVERTAYCAQVKSGWAVVSLTLPGSAPTPRTLTFSSTTYLRPTRSTLCDAA